MIPIQLPLSIRLRDDITFENFYSSPNRLAVNYIKNLCHNNINWTEDLIYLWGKEGSGKSHLLQAACIEVEKEKKRSIYLPLNEVIDNASKIFDNLESFELICIDNIDIICGDRGWEEYFFHFFNRVRDSGKKILISSLLPPQKMDLILNDLKSRLSFSLVFQLSILDDYQKFDAFKMRAAKRGLDVSDEAIHFILSRGVRNMSFLFSLLDELDKASLQAKRRITIPFLKQILGW